MLRALIRHGVVVHQKGDTKQIVADELQRIKNDPELAHLQ